MRCSTQLNRTTSGLACAQPLQPIGESLVETPNDGSGARWPGSTAPADCASRKRYDEISPASVESLTWPVVELLAFSDVISAASVTPAMTLLRTIAIRSSIKVNPPSRAD